MFGCDVSPEIARQSAIANESATVVVYGGDKPKEYSVKKHEQAAAAAFIGCDVSSRVAGEGATVASWAIGAPDVNGTNCHPRESGDPPAGPGRHGPPLSRG